MDKAELNRLRDELTLPEQVFVREYVTDYNAAKAVREAFPDKGEGYAKTLLKRRAVAVYATALWEYRNELLDIDALYVLKRLKAIDELDVADILDDEGNILPLKRWPKAWRTSVNSLKPTGRVGIYWPDKWPDKVKNLELLGKHVSVLAFQQRIGLDDEMPQTLNIEIRAVDAS